MYPSFIRGWLLGLLLTCVLLLELFDSLTEGIFEHMHLLDLDLATRLVGFGGEIAIDVIENRHGLLRYHFSED